MLKILQNRGNGVRRGKNNQLPETARTLKAGDLGFGTLLFLGKNLPSPRFKMNVYLQYDILKGKIKHNRTLNKRLKSLDKLLSGRETDNKFIIESELISEDDDIDLI